MIQQADGRLTEWVGSVLAGTPISLGPPSDTQTGRGISLYLLELAPAPPTAGAGRPPLQMLLRYLVTTWADEPAEAHRMLGELAFAAMESADFEVELTGLPLTAWTAFGVRPRPSFIVRLPLRRDRPLTGQLVRKPLVVHSVPLASLQGVILTPDDVPLAGARVEFAALHLFDTTDANGRFRFSAIPSEPRHVPLTVIARGHKLQWDAELPASENDMIVIRFDLEEG